MYRTQVWGGPPQELALKALSRIAEDRPAAARMAGLPALRAALEGVIGDARRPPGCHIIK